MTQFQSRCQKSSVYVRLDVVYKPPIGFIPFMDSILLYIIAYQGLLWHLDL